MQKRRHFKQTVSLADRLSTFAKEAGEKAAGLPRGPARDELLKKVRQAETALRLEGWTAPRREPQDHTIEDDHFAGSRHP
ncbi:hypothetical protein [Bradyrhizobium sp. B117]|uniref:hypothetical protein n=1 Tax=Bradyrhizobium sp. B117 TaxID=3140246 RepID=UPI0031831D5D